MSFSGQIYTENKAKLRILQLMSYKQHRIFVDKSWVIIKGHPHPPKKKKKKPQLKMNFRKLLQDYPT